MATQNLGNVRALIASTTAPTNTQLIWLDLNLNPARHKAYNSTTGLWELLSASAGEANTASNLTGGQGIFAQKNGIDLEFKSLAAGTNISLSSDANTITIDSTATGTVTGGLNVGGQEEVFKQLNAGNLEFRTLEAGTNMTITNNGDYLTFDASGGAGRDILGTVVNLDGTDYDLNIDNKVRLLEFNNGVSAQIFTVTIPTGTVELSAKYVLDNFTNLASVAVTWPSDFKWDDSWPTSGPPTLAAETIYRLELEKETNTRVWASLVPEAK